MKEKGKDIVVVVGKEEYILQKIKDGEENEEVIDQANKERLLTEKEWLQQITERLSLKD